MRRLPTAYRCLIAAAPAALLLVPSSAVSATNYWRDPLTLGPAPDSSRTGLATRVALESSGRGTVAWNMTESGDILAKEFTRGGQLGPTETTTKGTLIGAVARDQAGNVAISGQSSGTPNFAWVASKAKGASTWKFDTLLSGRYVNAPAAFGVKSGFVIAGTASFTPTTTDQGTPTAQAYGFLPGATETVKIGKELDQVETSDFAHGADGSNWTVASDGHALSTGRRETGAPKDGKAAPSVPALVRVGKEPTRYSILGAKRFGAGAIEAVGTRFALAGLDVQQTNDIAERGVPVVALGDDDTPQRVVRVGGVPDRRALDVDVAVLRDGGAVVTWIQQTSSRATSLRGRPSWAVVDEDGEVTERGTFGSTRMARDLRIVRVADAAVAVWVRGTGTAARWEAAKVDEDGARPIAAPGGTPVGRITGGLNTSQLTATGSMLALSFVDAKTREIKVAVQRVS